MSSLGPKRYDVFLSYNSQDRLAVHEVAERLKDEGLVLYLEEWELAPGREFQPALAEGLRDSKTCVVFLGPNGLGPWQKQELQVAIDKRARDEAFHVIPVLLPGTDPATCGLIWPAGTVGASNRSSCSRPSSARSTTRPSPASWRRPRPQPRSATAWKNPAATQSWNHVRRSAARQSGSASAESATRPIDLPTGCPSIRAPSNRY
jgi:hypothetical protein